MYHPPNELYTAFSFIGFLFCAIPLYWHLETWNMGTCLYMIWTGLGCLVECVNSIVWNKNTTNRAPVYGDISTRFQVALNAAIPASSLCINRRLYKAATAKTAMPTDADKRRAVISDLLIGVGIPILQIITQYVISGNRYNIFEDFGPCYSIVTTPPTFVLFYAWPLMIGLVSLYYCVTAIYALYKRHRQFMQLMTSSQGLNRGRYLRLMALASIEILGTIPIGTYILVSNSGGVTPYSWASVHSHYSEVDQIPSVFWKNNPSVATNLEMFRWLLVACAFIFFAFFGFADDARQHYRLVYTSLARRLGCPTSTLRGSLHVTPAVPHMSAWNRGGISVSAAPTREENRSSDSLTDETSIRTTFVASEPKPDLKAERHSSLNSVILSSTEGSDESRTQSQSSLPAEIMPTVSPASVPPHFPDKTDSTIRPYSGIDAV